MIVVADYIYCTFLFLLCVSNSAVIFLYFECVCNFPNPRPSSLFSFDPYLRERSYVNVIIAAIRLITFIHVLLTRALSLSPCSGYSFRGVYCYYITRKCIWTYINSIKFWLETSSRYSFLYCGVVLFQVLSAFSATRYYGLSFDTLDVDFGQFYAFS